jgi:protein SDA1
LLLNPHLSNLSSLLPLFFQLFKCPDRELRDMLYHHIINDIRVANLKARNNILNRNLQNFMYSMLTESHEIAARKSLGVMIELYRKNVWNDAKTVNVIATACFSSYTKIMVTALKFFLEADENRREIGEEIADPGYDEGGSKYSNGTDPGTTYKELLHSKKTGKKTKKK